MGERDGLARKRTTSNSAQSSAVPGEIPDKLVFRIGEVSRIVGVEPYVLRYWETEFSQLSPKKSGTGHRMYRRREVEQLLLIRQLLYERQYTIKGARQYLKELGQRRTQPREASLGEPADGASKPIAESSVSPPETSPGKTASSSPAAGVTIDGLREELRSILALLE